LYDKKIVGFVQLYETFDSLNLNKKLVLYDLYVLEKYRKLGIGRKLMNKSRDFAINNNFKRIELSTSIDNYSAQKLYESLDYIRDKEYYDYGLEVLK
jgi:ribosomal protein S18 acetylase RimI-like enzyme